jgi:hypothetical protein
VRLTLRRETSVTIFMPQTKMPASFDAGIFYFRTFEETGFTSRSLARAQQNQPGYAAQQQQAGRTTATTTVSAC